MAMILIFMYFVLIFIIIWSGVVICCNSWISLILNQEIKRQTNTKVESHFCDYLASCFQTTSLIKTLCLNNSLFFLFVLHYVSYVHVDWISDFYLKVKLGFLRTWMITLQSCIGILIYIFFSISELEFHFSD